MQVKYGILAYPNISFFPLDGFEYSMCENTKVVAETMSATAKDQHWATWLGSMEWESVSRAKAQVQTWVVSKTPEVVDGENQEIQLRLDRYAKALMLSDLLIPPKDRPFVLTGKGEVVDGHLVPSDIRTFGRGATWLQPGYIHVKEYRDSPPWKQVNQSARWQYGCDFFASWHSLYEQVARVGSTSNDHFLINLAFYSFQQALGEKYLDFSFPNLGRAVETLVTLAPGEGRSVFARRAKGLLPNLADLAFSFDDARVARILKESYGLRSDAVHGKPFGSGLGARRDEFLQGEVQYYVYLLETLARSTIRAFLSNEALLKATQSRRSLEEYWNNADPQPAQTACATCKRPLQGQREGLA